eukprot:280819-Prymnesium_polylepis.1
MALQILAQLPSVYFRFWTLIKKERRLRNFGSSLCNSNRHPTPHRKFGSSLARPGPPPPTTSLLTYILVKPVRGHSGGR